MTSADLTGRRPAPSASHPVATSPLPVRRVPGWWRDASAALLWAVLLYVTVLWVLGGGASDLGSVAGVLTSSGRLTGLLASALLLVQVFLMARVPWFEQAWGQDGLARLHRTVGFTSFNLLWAHILLITLGYAAASPQGLWGTVVDLVVDYPGMLLAVAGTVALCLVVATSVRRARARLRYESWHLIHLYGYLGAGLVLPHQLWTGQEFLTSAFATAFWWGLYAAAAGAVLAFRVALPLWRSLRAPLVVGSVRPEGPAATTVTVTGPGVGRLRVLPGQFLVWRFRDGPGWTRGHPYSLSAAPTGDTLRITVKVLGDASRGIAHVRPGTRVAIEGPYGRLHDGVRTRRKVLLLAGGIGVTPLRGLLEALPQDAGDVTLVYRASHEGDLILKDEIEALADARGAQVFYAVGPRVGDRHSWLPQAAAGLSDEDALRQLVPDVADRDVYVCGADGWMDAAERALLAVGVPGDAIHLERFSW